MGSKKWHPELLPRQRLKEIAMMFYGANASNNQMSAAIQLLIGVCEEQRRLAIKHGKERAHFRLINAGDPDLADLMQPVGDQCNTAEIVRESELERGRATIAQKLKDGG